MTTTETETIARRYVDAVGAHDLTPLNDLLDDALTARFAGALSSKAEWLEALNRLLPALIRNDIRDVFVAGDRACVVYDFVTDTPAGSVRCVELLTTGGGRILDIELVLDRLAFAPVNATLAERADAAS
ncbi:MAG: nuclear transport factor 2 family protein [Pseudolysinimonas sp.]